MARHSKQGEYPENMSGKGLRIGVVMARFNIDICEGMRSSCCAELAKLGADFRLATVPGALEIPLALQAMAQTGQYDALVALGTVIRGDTYHFEVVSNDACRGVMDVQLDTGVPIANGILTTENEDQALVRMTDKGRDCARAAVEMANLLAALDAEDEDEE